MQQMFKAFDKAQFKNWRIVTAQQSEYQLIDLTQEEVEASAGQERVVTPAEMFETSFCFVCYAQEHKLFLSRKAVAQID